MSKLTNLSILLLTVVLVLLVGSTALAQEDNLAIEITGQTCNLTTPCPEGLECITFPEIGLRCAQPNPCNYYECPGDTKCLVGESDPLQVICSPTDGAEDPGATMTAEKEIELDETVTAEDLGIEEPSLLPDSRFYFLKNWSRGIKSFFTFNKVKKAELKLKYASERLLETKKLAEKEKSPEEKQELLEEAAEKYKEEIERVKIAADKIKDNASTSSKVGKFLDKYDKQFVLHDTILKKLTLQVPTSTMTHIREAREQHLEKFLEVMTKLEAKHADIGERLEKNLEELKGSQFKQFKNLSTLKRVAEKAPEQAKESLQRAAGNTLERLKDKLETMPEQQQEKFKDYIERINIEAENKLEIVEDIRTGVKKALPRIRENLESSRERILEKTKEKIEERRGITCPQLMRPDPDTCQKGRWIYEKNEDGCPKPRCIEIGEEDTPMPEPIPNREAEDFPMPKPIPNREAEKLCITLWDPVCGRDGKTYSNKCWAEVARAGIDYRGVCKETTRRY